MHYDQNADTKIVASVDWKNYLKSPDRHSRLESLAAMRSNSATFPVCLAEDLLLLDLSIDEKCKILELTSSHNSAALEHFLTRYLFEWPQDLAALAVRTWAERTDHLLWFRLFASSTATLLPQRVLYTLIDEAHATGGSRLIERAASVDGLQTFSSALQGLLLHRAVQWSVSLPILAALSQRILREINSQYHPDHKAISSAVAYLIRFHQDQLGSEINSIREGPWREIMTGLRDGVEKIDKKISILSKQLQNNQTTIKQVFATLWPPVWNRHELPVSLLSSAIEAASQLISKQKNQNETSEINWSYFAGIPRAKLLSALFAIEDNDKFFNAIKLLNPLLKNPYDNQLIDNLNSRLATSNQTSDLFVCLPHRLRFEVDRSISEQSTWQQIKAEEIATLACITSNRLNEHLPQADIKDWSDQENDIDILGATNKMRKYFFYNSLRRQSTENTSFDIRIKDDFWSLLRTCWEKPNPQLIPQLAQAARPIEGVFRICYIATLGRFEGQDLAALKLLDFIRSKDEDEIRAVIQALAGIGTPRALQELVAAITRPNISASIQLEICSFLAKADVTSLQSEIRSAIKDLVDSGSKSASNEEVREALASLLSPISDITPIDRGLNSPQTDNQLDAALAAKIRHYKDLSSEVKRALRTSQFFHNQVTVQDAPESIDLSPVIDMQYKALELLFRECFEDHCSRLIQKGVLQRRLDILGYARPIPRAMDDFENYIGSLPTIREIPFFSKFKLRKTLRAICQFRPGKRFTLDGLKAFALFFLCFSRKQCRNGLEDLMPLGFKDDLALFEFVKTLHVMQDFRNRAAHEGFHPEASNDIDGIWRNTAQIVQTAIDARKHLDHNRDLEMNQKRTADSAKPVIIERKKVS